MELSILKLPNVQLPDFTSDKKQQKDEQQKRRLISEQLTEALVELESCRKNAMFADDPLLIDYYIYKQKANEMKYRYILKQSRQLSEHDYKENA